MLGVKRDSNEIVLLVGVFVIENTHFFKQDISGLWKSLVELFIVNTLLKNILKNLVQISVLSKKVFLF